MKKLLYTSSVDVSINNGPGVNEREFIDALLKASDVESYVLIPKPSCSNVDIPSKNIIYYRQWTGFMKYLIGPIMQAVYVLFTANKYQIDGIVVRTNILPLFLAITLCNLKLPVFVKTAGNPDMAWLSGNKSIKNYFITKCVGPFNIKLQRKIFFLAKVIDCCTPQLVNSVQSYLPCSQMHKVIHIENGTNTERFYIMDKSFVREKLDLRKDAFYLGYVGGLPIERGGLHIMRVVKELENNNTELSGIIVGGNTKDVEYLNDLRLQLNLEDRIIIAGKRPYEEIVYWINSFNVGIAFDRSERLKNIGSSNQKIRQYLACGIPVITALNTSRFIAVNSLGKLVSESNITEIAQAVKDIIKLKECEFDAVRIKARQFALDNFSTNYLLNKRMVIWRKFLYQ